MVRTVFAGRGVAGGGGHQRRGSRVGGCGVAFTAAATVLFPIAFTLLAAAAAFAVDEPASQVVDVTPTGPVRRTGIRAVALLAPLAAGAVVIMAGAQRGLALPWPATGLALAGNVLLGFAAACVVRTRTGEPGRGTARWPRAGIRCAVAAAAVDELEGGVGEGLRPAGYYRAGQRIDSSLALLGTTSADAA